MVGIPFEIVRESERGVEVQRVYLQSRRSGELGKVMRAAIREYRTLPLKRSVLAARLGVSLGGDGTRLMNATEQVAAGIMAEIDEASAELIALSQKITEAAVTVATAALQGNYGDGAEAIVDKLTDSELAAIVSTVELGQMPADFSQSLATRRTQSATGDGGNCAAMPSAEPAGAGTTGKAAE